MSVCSVEGHARGGKTVLNCSAGDALSQGDACDRLRQAEPLELLVLRCEPCSSLTGISRDGELEALQAFIQAPWMLLQAVLGISTQAGLKVVLELPRPTNELTQSVAAFWSCWLESRDFSNKPEVCKVQLRFLSEPSVDAS
jgi:hypothetical protein